MSEARDKLRGATVGAPMRFKSKIIEIDGFSFELREPSIGAWGDIISRSINDKGRTMLKEFVINVLLECCFVPGTNGKEKIFEDGDRDTISGAPRTSILKRLQEEASAMFDADAEEVAGKNSEATASNGGNLKLVNG